METNELSQKAKGGTELMLEQLHKRIDPDLLCKFQIIPSRVRDIDPTRKAILWLHDTASDPEAAHLTSTESRDRFAGFVLPSNWSMQMYNATLGLPYDKSTVLQNAITPIELEAKQSGDTIRIIYHTTPHRGLGILVPVFQHLVKTLGENVKLHLDVYSSFSIYGWSQRDEPFEPLFEMCRNDPNITYHGAVPNAEVRSALTQSDIFAYPSVWPETSCIAAIEALSARNLVVCPNYAALPETCANWAAMYQWSEVPNDHANRFAFALANAIYRVKEMKEGVQNGLDHQLDFQKSYFDSFYNWDLRAHQWTEYLKSLL
jgi:UDP-glucose:(glucosyl)LPS alpha-1,2-glucosyltransferase